MNTKLVKSLAILLTVLSLFAIAPVCALAADEEQPEDVTDTTPVLVISSDSLTVAMGKTIQLTAVVSNVDVQPKINWRSSNDRAASVDQNGLVKGKFEGKVTIIASTEVDGKVLEGEFTINVIKRGNLLQLLLSKHQVLSYQYSYVDDYYYTNDKDAWQHNFGFGKIYDFVSPYLLLEYDYVRVFFEYEGKDWMIQMWKGQYGMIFYGGEIGVYNRPHSDDGVHEWTMYNCPDEDDWLKMEMTLYHQDINGNYIEEFTREYDKYWWCTGFKNGHLRQEEPADELRLEGRITFKSKEMCDLFVSGLDACGFGTSETKSSIGLDQYYVEDVDVYFIWQNISSAENTMFIKAGLGTVISVLLLPYMPFILPYAGAFLILVLLASILV